MSKRTGIEEMRLWEVARGNEKDLDDKVQHFVDKHVTASPVVPLVVNGILTTEAIRRGYKKPEDILSDGRT